MPVGRAAPARKSSLHSSEAHWSAEIRREPSQTLGDRVVGSQEGVALSPAAAPPLRDPEPLPARG